jgi:hypothetical protein
MSGDADKHSVSLRGNTCELARAGMRLGGRWAAQQVGWGGSGAQRERREYGGVGGVWGTCGRCAMLVPWLGGGWLVGWRGARAGVVGAAEGG